MSDVVTRGSRSVHAIAICASDWPRRCAISFSARTCLTASWSIFSVRNRPSAARLSSGMPFRYLSVSMPWASGENAIQPTPSSPRTSSRSSSIQRLSNE